MAGFLRWSSFCILALLLAAISAAQAELTEYAVENEVKKLLVQYEGSQAELTKTFRRIVEILVSKRVHGEASPVQENDLETDYKQPLGTAEHVDLQKGKCKDVDRSLSEDFTSTTEPNKLQPKVAASDANSLPESYNATDGNHLPRKAEASDVKISDLPPHLIYMATWDEGIQVYSLKTGEVEMFAQKKGQGFHQRSVAYDWTKNQVYWSDWGYVYQQTVDGTGMQEIFSLYEDHQHYTTMTGLALDWVTNNIYGVTQSGHLFVCISKADAQLRCVTLVTEVESSIWGIALNPIERTMYWTYWNGIKRASMDGKDSTEIVNGFQKLRGISFDFETSRIYWVDCGSDVIYSSDSNGADTVTVIRLTGGAAPIGIIILEDRIYWGNAGNGGSLQTSTKAGHDVRTLVNGTSAIWQLATSAPAPGSSYISLRFLTLLA